MLQWLPGALVGGLWPEDRLVLGLRVCKWLSAELSHAHDVVLEATNNDVYEKLDARAVDTDLARFQCKRMSLHWGKLHRKSAAKPLLEGMLSFSRRGRNSLFRLDLSNMQLAVDGARMLAQVLGECSSVTALYLPHNKIGTVGACHLAPGLMGCKNLELLDLSDNCIRAHGLRHLMSRLGRCRALTHLDLSLNPFGRVPVKDLNGLSKCTALAFLGLAGNRHNQINIHGNFAEVLSDCQSLVRLDLSYNKVYTPACASLMWTLTRKCTALTLLNLSHNQMTCQGTGQDELEWDISDSEYDSEANIQSSRPAPSPYIVAPVLKSCMFLKYLILAHCFLQDKGARHLANCVWERVTLTHLDLSDNMIFADGVKALCTALKQCTNMQHLNLANNESGADGALSVGATLKHMPALAHLNVSRSGLGHEGLRRLMRGLVFCKNLTHLDVSYNRICASGLERVARNMGEWPSLTYLEVSGSAPSRFRKCSEYCFPIGVSWADFTTSFASVKGKCTSLTHLILKHDVCDDWMDSEGVRRLAGVMVECCSLIHLDLSFSQMCSEAVLGDALSKCVSLMSLNLACAGVLQHHTWDPAREGEVPGSCVFVDGLSKCTRLTHLDLSGLKCGPAGIECLRGRLAPLKSLIMLDLSDDWTGDEGACAMVELLKECHTLQHLNLNYNQVGLVWAQRLAQAASECTTLAHLELKGSRLTCKEAQKLCNRWRGNMEFVCTAYIYPGNHPMES